MKLQKYDLRLNKERNKSVLVKECCFSYPGYSLNNPEKIVAALNTVEDMEHLPEEHMYMLAFNSQLNVSGFFHISHGTVNMSVASPRRYFYAPSYAMRQVLSLSIIIHQEIRLHLKKIGWLHREFIRLESLWKFP